MEPGWYPDPSSPALQRYWDGWRWTQACRATPTIVSPPGVGLSAMTADDGTPASTPPLRWNPPYPYRPQTRGTNGYAIAALASGLVFAPLGIVLGHIALSQIRKTRQDGRGLAIAGLVVGYLWLVGVVAAGIYIALA